MPFRNVTSCTCPTKRAETPPHSNNTKTPPRPKLLVQSMMVVGNLRSHRHLGNQIFRKIICANVRAYLDFGRQYGIRQLRAIRQLQDIPFILEPSPQSIT